MWIAKSFSHLDTIFSQYWNCKKLSIKKSFSSGWLSNSAIFFRVQSVSHTRRGNTKKIRSILRPSILRLLLCPLVKGRRIRQRYKKIHSCYLLQRSGGASVRFSSYLPSTLPSSPSYTQSYKPVLHNYVRNSDEGLTERAPVSFLAYSIRTQYNKPSA
jgi:hypothetical protein